MFSEFQQKFARKLTNCLNESLSRHSDVTLLSRKPLTGLHTTLPVVTVIGFLFV
jgi:hypothetical protein